MKLNLLRVPRRVFFFLAGCAVLAILPVSRTRAQGASDESVASPAVIARGESFRVWQYTTTSTDKGQVAPETRSYTELEYAVQYHLTGEGTYQVGGKEALFQDMSLALQIDNGFTNKLCFLTNYDYARAVQESWPRIGVSVFQTNGTPWEQYSTVIVAAPMPRFLSVMPDAQTGNVGLDWQAYDAVQLERATVVTGPYSPVATNLTSQSFVDVGALTNLNQLYYRLRQQQ